MKQLGQYFTCLLVLTSTLISSAWAEDINTIFKKVNDYVAKENYSKAIEELVWANKELQKLHSKKIGTLLPVEVSGYKGGEVEIQSIMGMNSISRTYTKAGDQIELNITGGGQGSPLGGLGQMAAMLGGNQPGMDTFRIDGLTANLDTKSSRPELTLFMDSGSILQLKQRKKGEAAAETLKGFAKSINIGVLDKYLKGEVSSD